MEPEAASDTGFDLDAAVADIGSGLGLGSEPEPKEEQVEMPLEAEPEAKTEVPEVTVRPPPKSWAKETHEFWAKTDPKVQEYIEKREKDFLDGLEQYKADQAYAKQLKDILTPYQPILKAQGVNETQAVQYLMNAHYRLTNGTEAERKAAYEAIGRDLGISATQPSAAVQTDPVVLQLQKELNGIKSTLTQRQQAEFNEAKAAAEREVETFKADPANPYFDEVQQDMVEFINAGHSLKDAYDRAVWANPVVRQKELARIQTESAAQLKDKAKLEADAARKAASVNIRGQETRKAPTEPKGKLLSDEDMHATLKAIRERAN